MPPFPNELMISDLSAGFDSFHRINIVGCSGSGKTTTGKLIAKKLGYPYVELDEIQWKPNWTESTEEELFTNLERSLAGESWVLDGNYSKTVPIKWKRVQLIVWLDLPYWLILYQVISRTIRRSLTSEELWAGNRETLWKAFFHRDSIIWWSLTNLAKNRRQYLAAMSDARYSHIRFVRIRSRKELAVFVSALPDQTD
jgi:adenylate kinase family enzyme